MPYRRLTLKEIETLKNCNCSAEDWDRVQVSEEFSTKYVSHTRFYGDIKLGCFDKEFTFPGGMTKHSGIYQATLHNVEIGDNCCIENVKNFISNYKIGEGTFIENVDAIICDGTSTFGNGLDIMVMNETGGREVMIYDRLSSQEAYIMALYRHRPELISNIKASIIAYTESIPSDFGVIGKNVTIADTGFIKNVKISDYSKVEGAFHLKNGSINSNEFSPTQIGVGVIAKDFIICSGSVVEDGANVTKCFVGQNCTLSHGYLASESLFFANCHGENGEACSIFAGPYTVTHHKSTLLIAGQFSFMNAGSGSNQSNHMYKLGPIHQGIMERGAKTSSDSYILWPARIGAFSLVMGRHVSHQDTSNLPFSYLIENQGVSYIAPGANLKSVGTIRDAKKWPQRDKRPQYDRLDCINYNLLSPYTMQKVLNGIDILNNLKAASGSVSSEYSYQSGKITGSALKNGLTYYRMVLDKFFGNSLISRILKINFKDLESLRKALVPDIKDGDGDWVDMSGLIAPKNKVNELLDKIEAGDIKDMNEVKSAFNQMHKDYYDFEWVWAYKQIEKFYNIDLMTISLESLLSLIIRWKESVIKLDNMLYEDARKEFSLSSMTSFGVDGDKDDRLKDFTEVRGSSFEKNPFVKSIKDHITAKTNLYEEVKLKLENIY